ncbi:hypothetical protein TNCV_3582211 [Trichonephila clavipes]|nr:hypothetical protein TNCV_3582211 [Trichonephila clavipes]
MSVQKFLKLEEALELLNNLDSDNIDVEISVLQPDVSELTDEDDWDGNERNIGEITEGDVPGSLKVRLLSWPACSPDFSPVKYTWSMTGKRLAWYTLPTSIS